MSVLPLFAALSLAHVDAFVPPANALLLRRHPTIHASRIIAAPSVARTTAAEMAEVVAPALAATATTPTLTVEVASAQKARPATPWKTLLRLCAPDLPLLVGAFVMLTVAATGDALLPALQGAALNTALGLETQGHASLRGALLQLLGVGIGTAIATGIRGFLFWICGARLVQRLRATLFEALLAQPQAFHDAQGPGELSSRLATDCVKLGDVLSLNVNIVLRQVLQSVAGVAIIMRLNGKLAGLVLLGVALRSTFAHFYSKATRRISQAQQNALAASSGVAEQCLSLIKVVRSHGNDGPERARYGGQLDRLLALQSDQGMLYGFSRVFNGGINAVLLVAILAVGASFVSTGVLPKESLTSFVLYVSFISDASGDVADQWSRIQEALGAATEVFDYLEPRPLDLGISKATATAPPPPPPPAEAESAKAAAAAASAAAGAVGATRGSLSLDCVDFAYPSRPTQNVFEGLSLTIPAGQRVAIVGGSGSGKSTIFALALRFYAPASGAVKLDGVDVSAIAEAEMRRKIAWVQQEPPLFPNSTIRENIAYGLKECPLETVEAAAKEANAHDFIDRLPLGYDTRIGGAGASLSGGQKQRVALARALVRDPSLLLLDEATSALDPESEQLVEAAIARAARERTVLFTTHKVAQARAADRIIVLSRGHIIEDGTHAELLRLGGAYASLLKMGDDVSEEQAASVVDMVEQGGVVALADA